MVLPPPPTREIERLLAEARAVRIELAALAEADAADHVPFTAVREHFQEIAREAQPYLSPPVALQMRSAEADWVDQPARQAALAAIDGAAAELNTRLLFMAYRRSALRAAAAGVLWLIATAAFAGFGVSALVAVPSLVGGRGGDLGRASLGAAAFYLLVAFAFVALGFALWRRHDPRPRLLAGASALCEHLPLPFHQSYRSADFSRPAGR